MNKGTPIVFHELMHLDAPLALAELINYGETIKEVPWAKETFEVKPYCVFERKEGVLYFFYDQNGIDWKLEQAVLFDEAKLGEEVLKRYGAIEDIIKNEKILAKEEFSEFITNVKDFWPWLDGIWWAIENRDKKNLNTDNLMKVRKHTEYFIPGLIATIRNTFKNILPEHKEYADVLLIEEVIGAGVPDEGVLKRRMQTWAYTEGKLFHSLEEVKALYNVVIKEETFSKADVLKGQTAYPGKVVGVVKIIKNREDMNKFQEGNIIVSPTTTPDFLPIMKICGAIISEHGGVICHASITSRELKIPCVVGVKGATKVLKDGDIVEVDADHGIVRIMK